MKTLHTQNDSTVFTFLVAFKRTAMGELLKGKSPCPKPIAAAIPQKKVKK